MAMWRQVILAPVLMVVLMVFWLGCLTPYAESQNSQNSQNTQNARNTKARTIKLCNETSYFLNVATAMQLSTASRSRGWQKIIPGTCSDSLILAPPDAQVFVYARSDDLYAGAGQHFEGAEQFCISSNADFDIDGRRECQKRGWQEADFAIAENDGTAPRILFTDPLDFGKKRAPIAAAQRLLAELDYDIGMVDGFTGRRTIKAIDDFQEQKNLPKSYKVTTNFLRILYEHSKTLSHQYGLDLCNDTENLVWAAIGQVHADGFKTEGWLHIAPAQCRKAIRNPLTARYYFVYAESVDEQGAPLMRAGKQHIWGGKFNLCTKPTRFIIDNHNDCKKRGLNMKGFMKIDTGNQINWVTRFE